MFCTCHRHAVILSTFFICFLTLGTAYGNAAVYYNFWLDYFQDLRSTTALIGSVNIGLIMILGPVASMLANRFGHRIIVCTGAVISSLSMFAASFASSVSWLLATHIICGVGWCLCMIPGSMAVSFYWREKYHGIIFGITISGVGFGQFVTPLLVEFLTEIYSWRGALLVQSGINLHLLGCGAMLIPVDGMKKTSNFMELGLLKDGYFTNTLIYWFLCHMGISVAGVHIAYVMTVTLGASYQQSAWLTALFGISGACARIGHGYISSLRNVNVLLQQLVCVTMMAACLVSMPYVHNLPLMVAVIIVAGTAMGSMSLNSIITIYIVGLKSRTAGFGFFATAAGLGLACGAPIAGYLSDITNGFAVSLYFGGGVQLLSVATELGPLIRWKYIQRRHIEDIPAPDEDVFENHDDENDEEWGEEEAMRVKR